VTRAVPQRSGSLMRSARYPARLCLAGRGGWRRRVGGDGLPLLDTLPKAKAERVAAYTSTHEAIGEAKRMQNGAGEQPVRHSLSRSVNGSGRTALADQERARTAPGRRDGRKRNEDGRGVEGPRRDGGGLPGAAQVPVKRLPGLGRHRRRRGNVLVQAWGSRLPSQAKSANAQARRSGRRTTGRPKE